MNANAATQITITSGMLMPKAQRQEACSDSHPPSSGPSAVAAPMVEPQTANACPRALPVNEAFSSDSDVGRIRAAPAPCRKRASTNISPLGASPASRLVIPNRTTPVMKTRRAPTMSATRPTNSSNAANTMA